MTNLEYSNHLINELKHKKAEAIKMYENIKTSKKHLNSIETSLYLKQVNEYLALADLAELVMKKLIDGSILPMDPMD